MPRLHRTITLRRARRFVLKIATPRCRLCIEALQLIESLEIHDRHLDQLLLPETPETLRRGCFRFAEAYYNFKEVCQTPVSLKSLFWYEAVLRLPQLGCCRPPTCRSGLPATLDCSSHSVLSYELRRHFYQKHRCALKDGSHERLPRACSQERDATNTSHIQGHWGDAERRSYTKSCKAVPAKGGLVQNVSI